MSFVHFLYIVIFGTWLFFTLIFQLPAEKFSRFKWLSSLDFFSLIPRWTFFAPNPGQSDYHLLYRDIWLNGNISNWKNIDIGYADNYLKFFWNPLKRKSKTIHDVFSQVIAEYKNNQDDFQRLKVSLPYLVLLHYVNHQAHDIYSVKVQFMIMEAFGYNEDKEPAVLILSDIHRLC